LVLWVSFIFLNLFGFIIPLFSQTPIELSKRVDAHLLIGDYLSAINDAEKNVKEFPDSELAHEMLLRSLAVGSDDDKMMREWSLITQKFPHLKNKRELLEEMCLSILKKGCSSDSLTTRLIGYIAIAKSKLPEAVNIIKQGLNDSNAHLRSLNVEIASVYGDTPLREELKALFFKEKSIEVRLEILKAIETLKLTEMLPHLTKSLEMNSKISSIEKKQTIITMAALREKCTKEELEALIQSGRSWEVELACMLIRKWHLYDEACLLYQVIEKGTKESKIEALTTLGFLQKGESLILEKASLNEDHEIAITASWALGFIDPFKMQEALSILSKHEKTEIRCMAVSALMLHGKKSLFLAKKILKESNDPYVRANVALNLLRLRIETQENGDILYNFLQTTKDKLMLKEGSFPYICRTQITHSPIMPNQPEAVNQAVRLDILNLLSIVDYSKADAAIRNFLKESRWEIAGSAAETLLQEGDESAIEIVRQLLDDPDKHIQTQSALLLALWGKDPTALSKLIELYEEGDRTLKIKILEALGFIGEDSTIGFLVERLKEPSHIFRLVAACVLLETLYH
jgi:HEAT repeat protein